MCNTVPIEKGTETLRTPWRSCSTIWKQHRPRKKGVKRCLPHVTPSCSCAFPILLMP